MSFGSRIVTLIFRIYSYTQKPMTNVEEEWEKSKKYNRKHKYQKPKNNKAEYDEIRSPEGHPCLIIKSKKTEHIKDKAIMFIYGGINYDWKMQLNMAIKYADRTGITVYYPIYPPVSAVPVTESIESLYNIYKMILHKYDSQKITIVGLSFGGTFAFEIVNWINRKDENIPMPGLILAHSPGGLPENEEGWRKMEELDKKDCMLSVDDMKIMPEFMAHGKDIPAHAVYPIYEDFHDAPETYVWYGDEVLYANADKYREAYIRDGSGEKIHMHHEKGLMHGYSSIPILSESKKSYNKGIELIKNL